MEHRDFLIEYQGALILRSIKGALVRSFPTSSKDTMGGISLVVVVIFLFLLIAGGGRHGPGRHLTPSTSAPVTSDP